MQSPSSAPPTNPDSLLPPPPPAAPRGAEKWSHSGQALRPPGLFDRFVERSMELVGPMRLHAFFSRRVFRAAGLEERYVRLPNGRVHAWIAKRRKRDLRPTLLLIHGFGADAETQWLGQVWELSKHHRLVVPDLLYFGGSQPHRRDVSLDHQIDTVLQLMDYLRIERFDLLGISFGGFVAFEVAAHHPHRVNKVILSNSPGHVFEHEDHESMLVRLGVAEIAELLVPGHPSVIRDLLSIAYHRPPRAPRVALRDAFRRHFRNHAEERREIMRKLTDRIGEEGLEDRRIPHDTLVLWGEHDRVFPVEIARRLRAAIGEHARLHVIPDTAHAPNQEKPLVYNRVVLDFLNERNLGKNHRFASLRA